MIDDLNISIITVVYNAKEDLEKTIHSILNQTYKNIEFIIIDGSSTDGTVDIINKYDANINNWVSEKDKGIYDAMNKGANLANGDFIVFMNAGDIFYENNTIEKFINNIDDTDKVYFGRAKINSNISSWQYPNMQYNINNIDIWLQDNLPNHQAMFFPKIFYKSYKYNLDYKIGSDSDYKFQSQSECGFIFLDEVISQFDFGGISSEFNSFKNTKQILKDSWYISMKHKGLLYALKRQFRIITKYIISCIFGNNLLKSILKRLRG